MRVARTSQTFRSSIRRWLLIGLLSVAMLCAGLVCSIEHGAQLGAFSAGNSERSTPVVDAATHKMSMMEMTRVETSGVETSRLEMSGMDMTTSDQHHPAPMHMPMDDCAFAGIVTLAMLFFIAVGWLQRRRPPLTPRRENPQRQCPREAFPALSPQAP